MDDIAFTNMDTWKGSGSGKFGLNFKQIVLMHINRCVQNGSVEWMGGYWETKHRAIGGGQVMSEQYYVPSTRDVYCNSVRMLRACLVGYFDKKIIPIDKQIQEELENIYQEYIKANSEEEGKSKSLKREYYESKINLHIKWFEELIMLSKRLNFFEEESAEEEM